METRVGRVLLGSPMISGNQLQRQVSPGCFCAGDCGLEIAPGKDVEENPDLHKVGNIWNAVPVAKHWTALDPIEGCITVNIGDGLQWWTDGLFKSTYHRVRVPRDGDNKV